MLTPHPPLPERLGRGGGKCKQEGGREGWVGGGMYKPRGGVGRAGWVGEKTVTWGFWGGPPGTMVPRAKLVTKLVTANE